jgi:hypothetical protein
MMNESVARLDCDFFEPRRSLRPASIRYIGIALAALATACLGAWIVRQSPAVAPDLVQAPPARIAAKVSASPYGALIDPVSPSAPVSSTMTSSDQRESRGEAIPAPPASSPLLELPPLPPTRDFDRDEADVPLPPIRPAELARAPSSESYRRAPSSRQSVAAVAPPDTRNFLEKLLGLPSASPATVASPQPRGGRESNTTLAYAAPSESATGRAPSSGGLFGGLRAPSFSPTGRYDQYTAVYDISAHVVYMPDGSRLEAHSGLGDRLDDPRHVDERMRGATPPHVYELTAREGSFHGVQALRLNPVGGGGIFGRAGLLAHPFMLGPNGDSNGCVSVRDYDAFLRAYQSGRIKTLVVVSSL